MREQTKISLIHSKFCQESLKRRDVPLISKVIPTIPNFDFDAVSRYFLLQAPQCPCFVHMMRRFAADNPSTLSCIIRRAGPTA